MTFMSLRFIERICGVIIGGVSIYLGYRLFLQIPEQHDSGGKLVLPWDVTVVLRRVGPGIFFTLFGASVVGASFFKGVALEDLKRVSVTLQEHSIKVSGAGAALEPRSNLHGARALLRREIATLNALPKQLKPDLAEHDRDDIARSLRRIKFALMRDVWDSAEWGPVAEFESWIDNNELDPPPASVAQAVAYYRCPAVQEKPCTGSHRASAF